MTNDESQDRMVEDWEIEEIPKSTTGSEPLMKTLKKKKLEKIEFK